jgi:hypothetical protein
MLIDDIEIRVIIEAELEKLRTELPLIKSDESGMSNSDLSFIDVLSEMLIERGTIAFESTIENHKKELNFSYLCIMAIGLAARALESHDGDEFKHKGEQILLGNLITQISNNALAVVTLVEKGLDNQARSIVRILNELIWLTIVVFSNEEKMKTYVETFDESKERKLWSKHFNFKNLNKVLLDLEKKMGFPEDMIQDFEKGRRNNYYTYSKAIHSSMTAIIGGSFGTSIGEGKTIKTEHILFGAPSIQSDRTLSSMNWELYYFLLMFYEILVKFRGVKLDVYDIYWRGANTLYRSVRAVQQSEYYMKENEDISQYDFA